MKAFVLGDNHNGPLGQGMCCWQPRFDDQELRGHCADFDGDMTNNPPPMIDITLGLNTFNTKFKRRVKKGPGRGRYVRMKVFTSRNTYTKRVPNPLWL